MAILGAGPIGLEAGLYARFLGYDVRIFDRGRVAENVRRWGHVKMFTPMSMNTSSLGRAALRAQEHSASELMSDDCPTGSQWVERYLLPLAQSDLLADSIFENTEVLSVTRWNLWKGQKLSDQARDDVLFRVLVRDQTGAQRAESADVVIDTTGVFANSNWLGPGGAPALGEMQLREQFEYEIPDVLGAERQQYSARRTLVVGSGYSAATTIVALAQLAAQTPDTTALWLTQICDENTDGGPLRRIPKDRLPERDLLARRANEIANGNSQAVQHRSGWLVTAIKRQENQFQVQLENSETDQQITEPFDQVVANVGYHPDVTLFRELHVHQCYASEGPMRLAASLLKGNQTSADCLDQKSGGADSLRTTEPSFYILGSKSYGRASNFLYGVGLEQIRDLFSLIGDRANLDLYANAENLPQ
jgi:thioredoxin reductase